MGYEVKIIYHPKTDTGYDLSAKEEKTRRIGKAYDERDDAKLAKEVLKQLSRRDVLVSEVEVVEFVRKTVKVKMSANGFVIIRGKKYSLDGADLGEEQIEPEQTETPAVVAPTPTPQQVTPQPAHPAPSQKPIKQERPALRKEIFDPPLAMQLALKSEFDKRGLVTGQAYEILEEKETKYIIRLPDGREVEEKIEFFDVADTAGLGVFEEMNRDGDVDLDMPSRPVEADMPKIR